MSTTGCGAFPTTGIERQESRRTARRRACRSGRSRGDPATSRSGSPRPWAQWAGLLPGVGAGRAGISMFRPCPPAILARLSTFTAAAPTCRSRITKTKSPRAKPPPASPMDRRMHAGPVRVDDEKMSKSLGNFFTIRELERSRSGALFPAVEATTAARSTIPRPICAKPRPGWTGGISPFEADRRDIGGHRALCGRGNAGQRVLSG